MDAPRLPNIILDELMELDGIITEGDTLSHQFPNDNFLKISQHQARNRKLALQGELFASQKYYGQQSFVLAFDKELGGMDAHLIPNVIKAITDILDRTQELITNKAKNVVPVMFNGVVQSSFGLHFTISHGQELFGNSYDDLLGIIFESIRDLNQTSTNEEIRKIIDQRFEGHKPILKSYRSFFQSVSKADLPLKVIWKSPASNDLQFRMESEQTDKLYKEFKKSLLTTEGIREYRGEVQGLSQWANTVEFLATSGAEEIPIVAEFDPDNTELFKQLQAFNKPRIAVFNVKESLNEFTDESNVKYTLIELKKVN